MKVKDLLAIIKDCDEDQLNLEVLVRLKDQSIGPIASTKVRDAYFGFDWDKDFILDPLEGLSKQTLDQEHFYKVKDFLFFLATKDEESFEKKKSQSLLKKLGHTDEEFVKYKKIFQRN